MKRAVTLVAAAFWISFWLSQQPLEEFLGRVHLKYNTVIGLLILASFVWLARAVGLCIWGLIVCLVLAGRRCPVCDSPLSDDRPRSVNPPPAQAAEVRASARVA